jgi:hypothetical protein
MYHQQSGYGVILSPGDQAVIRGAVCSCGDVKPPTYLGDVCDLD